MKKIFKALVALIVFVVVVIFTTIPVYCKNYNRVGIIDSIDYKLNEWVVLDTTGNLWSFSDGEDLLEKDVVIMEMEDNNTPIIYDDIITHIYYIGYFE